MSNWFGGRRRDGNALVDPFRNMNRAAERVLREVLKPRKRQDEGSRREPREDRSYRQPQRHSDFMRSFNRDLAAGQRVLAQSARETRRHHPTPRAPEAPQSIVAKYPPPDFARVAPKVASPTTPLPAGRSAQPTAATPQRVRSLEVPPGTQVSYAMTQQSITLPVGWKWPITPGSRIAERDAPIFVQIVEPNGDMWLFEPLHAIEVHKNFTSVIVHFLGVKGFPSFHWDKRVRLDENSYAGGIGIESGWSKDDAAPLLHRMVELLRDSTYSLGRIDAEEIEAEVKRFLATPEVDCTVIPYKACVQLHAAVQTRDGTLEPGVYETKINAWRASTGEVLSVRFDQHTVPMSSAEWRGLVNDGRLTVSFVSHQSP